MYHVGRLNIVILLLLVTAILDTLSGIQKTIIRSVSADLFLNTIGNLFLEQLVNESTRIRNEQTSSLLDPCSEKYYLFNFCIYCSY